MIRIMLIKKVADGAVDIAGKPTTCNGTRMAFGQRPAHSLLFVSAADGQRKYLMSTALVKPPGRRTAVEKAPTRGRCLQLLMRRRP
jgi:hypothetical protein